MNPTQRRTYLEALKSEKLERLQRLMNEHFERLRAHAMSFHTLKAKPKSEQTTSSRFTPIACEACKDLEETASALAIKYALVAQWKVL